MKFGAVPVRDAAGAVLAHTLRAGGRVLKKGRVLSAGDVELLAGGGYREVVCARLEPGELTEDAAASRIATAIAAAGTRLERTHTGRTNVHAAVDGLVAIDRAAIARANAIDEAITVATVPALSAVRTGEMVATIKIIPFAAREAAVMAAADAVRGGVAIQPWRGCQGGLVLTRFPETPQALLDRAAAAQRTRLERCGGGLGSLLVVAHEQTAVAAAIARQVRDGLDPILVLGASAIMDRRDVIPAALEYAGGEIVRLGMPVDPGNLLMLGQLRGTAVIGVPGCARSLKPSGFDWVLQRICAGIAVESGDVAAMGVGGLLDEIAVRPSPRSGAPGAADPPDARAAHAADGDDSGDGDDGGEDGGADGGDDRREPRSGAGDSLDARSTGRVAAVVLAAGRASRMGSNKLIADLGGEPIVRRTVRAA